MRRSRSTARAALSLLLAACARGGETGDWIELAGGTRAGAPRIGFPARLEDGGEAARIEFDLPPEAWEKAERAGFWRTRTRAPCGPFSLEGSGGELTLRSARGSLEILTALGGDPLERLPVGAACLIGDAIVLRVAEAGELPSPLTLSLRLPRRLRGEGSERPRIGEWIGRGFSLWSGEEVEFTLELPPRSALCFFLALERAAEDGGEAATLLRVALDGETVHERRCTAARQADGAWERVSLPEAGRRRARLSFSLDGGPALGAVLAPTIGPGDPGGPRADPRPDLVLFLADTFRADNLAIGGGDPALAPNLNALAEQSVRFPRAWAPSGWTLPAQASMFTGLYPEQHGAIKGDRAVSGELVTLAEHLRAHGYRTGAVTDGLFVSHKYGFDQGFGWFRETGRSRWSLAETLRSAAEFLRADDGRPAFLFVHTYRTHYPYRLGLEEDDGAMQELVRELLARFAPTGGDGTLSGAEAGARARALYLKGVEALDERFGGFLAELDGLGFFRSGYLVFTSDHGEKFFEHGELTHGRMPWEPGIRIPLLVRGPGLAPRTVSESANLVDLPPTLAALAGVPGLRLWEGKDLLAPGEDRTAYSFSRFGENSVVALMEGPRKVVAVADPALLARGEFITASDLARDPGERERNRGEEWPAALCRDRSADLERLLRALVAVPSVEIEAEVREDLAALGYGGQ